jgi:signal transduction histidine kinase
MSAPSLEGTLTRIQQIMAAALILLFAGFSIWVSATALKRQEEASAARLASQVAASIAEEERETPNQSAAIQDALSDAADAGRVRVFDARGREIASVGAQLVAGQRTRDSRASIPGGGWIVASVSTEPRQRAVLVLAGALLATGIPLFVIASTMSRTIARRALRPLSRIATQAEGITWNGARDPFHVPNDPVEVSALSQAFDRLLERLDAALRAERCFTEDAAHELRTPVTVLRGEIEHAKQELGTSAQVRDALDRALEQADGMADLVEALLLLRLESQPGANKDAELRQPVNLCDVVRDLAWDFRERFPDRAGDLEIVVEDELLVAGHATLLMSAIRNLVSNALKFTSTGQRVQISVHRQNGLAAVVVEDAGEGIAQADRERVFDPFFRAGEARAGQSGFGLGLPILKRVAGVHGGEVLLSRSELGGARFDLLLPTWESLPALVSS